MIIAIGADHSGYNLKLELINYLQSVNIKVVDVGTYTEEPCDYPDYASLVCEQILEEVADLGILICGSGIGMSIAANRHSGIRAALCSNEVMAAKSRQHNDANILVLGARQIAADLAQKIVDVFLRSDFEGGRHSARLAKIS